MRKFYLFFVIPALLALPARAAAGELKLSIENGLVTLVADEVPVSAIMAEWARVGQTQIVNGDKISTPVSLQIVNMPERRALDIVLRVASGYMVAERQMPMVGASAFDRIMILPTSQPPANTGPVFSPPPAFAPQRPVMPAVPDMDDEQPMPPGMTPEPQTQPGVPMPNVPGANQPTTPGQQTPGMPNAPLTAPRPGQLPAPQPQQPVPFGTPNKPGGGGGSGGEGVS